MLALNASYRSCKSGEAGRGLRSSGVSGNCYGRTDQEYKVSITELISNVSASIQSVVDVIHQMLKWESIRKRRLHPTHRQALEVLKIIRILFQE